MRIRTLAALVAGAVIVLGLAFVRVCADGGAMASTYRTCDCVGFEWQLYDGTEADGPRRTLCLGVTRAKTCYQFRSGPEVSCSH